MKESLVCLPAHGGASNPPYVGVLFASSVKGSDGTIWRGQSQKAGGNLKGFVKKAKNDGKSTIFFGFVFGFDTYVYI